MNKLILPMAMSLMLLSTSAMALTININKKSSSENTTAAPPPPPPPPPPVKCVYSEPKCDRHDRIHAERYRNDQQMYSRGQCIRGEKERNFDFYCSNGDVWMKIDFRRDEADRIDCFDPRRGKFFAARTIQECEKVNVEGHKPVFRDNPPPPPKRHHHNY